MVVIKVALAGLPPAAVLAPVMPGSGPAGRLWCALRPDGERVGTVPDMRYPVPGGAVAGFLAVPGSGPGPWPGVVVIHEAFGLNDDIRRKADELAARGYLALAPDLYGGKSWVRCIRAAFGQLRRGAGPAFEVLDTARGFLAVRADCTGKTGVIGFCMGGGFALLCAPRAGYDAAAVNYGEVPAGAEEALAGACPGGASFGGRGRG